MAGGNTDCKVYVGNLKSYGSKQELETAFSKFGPVVNVWVARNPPGFAFVEFNDPRDAEDSVRGMDGARVCGVRIRVEMATGRSRNERRSPPMRRRFRSRSPRYGRNRSRSPRRSRSNSRSPRFARRASPRYDDYRKRGSSSESRGIRSRSRS